MLSNRFSISKDPQRTLQALSRAFSAETGDGSARAEVVGERAAPSLGQRMKAFATMDQSLAKGQTIRCRGRARGRDLALTIEVGYFGRKLFVSSMDFDVAVQARVSDPVGAYRSFFHYRFDTKSPELRKRLNRTGLLWALTRTLRDGYRDISQTVQIAPGFSMMPGSDRAIIRTTLISLWWSGFSMQRLGVGRVVRLVEHVEQALG